MKRIKPIFVLRGIMIMMMLPVCAMEDEEIDPFDMVNFDPASMKMIKVCSI